MRLLIACLLGASVLGPGRAAGATRKDVTEAAVRAGDRLAALRTLARTWEDAPYLVGLLLVARDRESRTPGAGLPWIDRVDAVVGAGDAPLAHGDSAGYAQAAMDLYRTASREDVSRRARLLSATAGPFAFAGRALRVGPSDGPPEAAWWLEGGYGTRFWVDDLFTLPPALAMRGSGLDSLPADAAARDLAYEWIESYLYDHRPPATTDAESAAVPSRRARGGPLLWDPARALFRHDAVEGWDRYWGRGNGWAAWGLARCARYLDAPYGGGRYEKVLDRTAIREVLSRLAASLAASRAGDGGWPSDLLRPDACGASETSATGLIAYMLAAGVNEGWLDRETFTPIVLKALSLLLGRVDARGDLSGIQPPGTGPDCSVVASDDAAADVSYGVGALLLAVSEALKLPDAALATMEAEAARPIQHGVLPRTWIVALPETCERPEVVLVNAGPLPVNARLDAADGTALAPSPTRVPPGGTAVLGIAGAAANPGPAVATLRADGDLVVRPRGVCEPHADFDDAIRDLARLRPRRAGGAVPLWTALSGGESVTFAAARAAVLTLGGRNVSPADALLDVTITPAGASPPAPETLRVPAGRAAFETRFVAAGSRLTVSNRSEGSSVVPLVFER